METCVAEGKMQREILGPHAGPPPRWTSTAPDHREARPAPPVACLQDPFPKRSTLDHPLQLHLTTPPLNRPSGGPLLCCFDPAAVALLLCKLLLLCCCCDCLTAVATATLLLLFCCCSAAFLLLLCWKYSVRKKTCRCLENKRSRK